MFMVNREKGVCYLCVQSVLADHIYSNGHKTLVSYGNCTALVI